MLKYIKFRALSYFLLLCTFCAFSQSDSLIYNNVSSYRNWNWEALVIENNYITTALVPSMGGNMLQYDFGIDTFLITNPVTYGNTYDPALNQSPFNGDWGFGGFEVWSTPENWPPSPVLTFGEYQDTLLFQSADSLQVKLISLTEINSFPGIRYEKLYTAYKNSTLIKFQNSMFNTGSATVKYGMMNVAEILTEHADLEDYSNFKAYFPIRSNSIFGKSCVRISPVSSAFQGEIAPGIYGVEYIPVRGKVFADSPVGWMAFVDERDNQTYVCMYDVFEGAEYPDQGANTEVYVENALSFMALEAISPLVNLSPLVDTLKFTEYFASTRLSGRVLKVNKAGAVAERLSYDSLTQHLTGKFGVFSKSNLMLQYCDSLGNMFQEGMIYPAVPDTTVIIDEELMLPPGTELIKLRAFNEHGDIIADIDEEDFKVDEFVVTSAIHVNKSNISNEVKTYISDNDELKISFNIDNSEFVKIELINISCKIEYELYSGRLNAGNQNMTFSLIPHLNKFYILRITGEKNQFIKKLVF